MTSSVFFLLISLLLDWRFKASMRSSIQFGCRSSSLGSSCAQSCGGIVALLLLLHYMVISGQIFLRSQRGWRQLRQKAIERRFPASNGHRRGRKRMAKDRLRGWRKTIWRKHRRFVAYFTPMLVSSVMITLAIIIFVTWISLSSHQEIIFLFWFGFCFNIVVVFVKISFEVMFFAIVLAD